MHAAIQSCCEKRLSAHIARCNAIRHARSFGLVRCMHSQRQPRLTDTESPDALWLQILSLRAQLHGFVGVEDFASAARVRDQVATLLSKLSPLQQHEYFCLEKLQNGTVVEKRQALASLAQMSTSQYVVARIADCLKDEHLVGDADQALHAIWLRHPTNADINDKVSQGLDLMRQSHTYELALGVFDEIVKMDPTFAEGWNKRATLKYLLHRFVEAVEDCEKVIKLQPLHYSAMSGMGLCLVQLKQYSKATQAFEDALRLNPSLTQIKRYVKALKNGQS